MFTNPSELSRREEGLPQRLCLRASPTPVLHSVVLEAAEGANRVADSALREQGGTVTTDPETNLTSAALAALSSAFFPVDVKTCLAGVGSRPCCAKPKAASTQLRGHRLWYLSQTRAAEAACHARRKSTRSKAGVPFMRSMISPSWSMIVPAETNFHPTVSHAQNA